MNKNILSLLACPECKGDLELNSDEQNDDEVINGLLICKTCNMNYQIIKGIPNFIPEHALEIEDV